MHAIVLAGGLGTRLRPLTDDKPKAMVEVGGVPLLELVVRKLSNSGFRRVTLCVAHLAEMVIDHFGDGAQFGVAVDYSVDREPLGTAGPLGLVPEWTSTALVMNCDVLTTLNLATLYRTHRHRGSALTVAARQDLIPVEMGVLDLADDSRVIGIREKPSIAVDIAAGIYVAEPSVRRHIPADRVIDMPGLITELSRRGLPVHAYTFTDEWHDGGTPAGYERARQAFTAAPERFLDTADDSSAPVAGGGDREERHDREDGTLAPALAAVRANDPGPGGRPDAVGGRLVVDDVGATP